MKPRPAWMIAVAGLTEATALIQPSSRSSGRYTGARKRIRKTGVCSAGADCTDLVRMNAPAAKNVVNIATSRPSA